MEDRLKATSPPNQALTPTPGTTFRCFGHWVIASPLGRGAYGKVSSATNNKGELVAINIIERSERTAYQVSCEVHILRELLKLSEVREGDRKGFCD